MAVSIIPGFQAAKDLGRFAEQLLMYDTVTVQVTRPHDIVQILEDISPAELEKLLDEDALRLVLDHGMGLASSRRAAEIGETEYVQHRIIAEPSDCLGYMVPFVTTVSPSLLDELDHGLRLWTKVPESLRRRLLSGTRTLPFRFEPILKQTKLDLLNPSVLSVALPALQSITGVPLREEDVHALLAREHRGEMSASEKGTEALFRRLVTRIMRANSNLYQHTLGFTVSGGSGDQAIFEAKLESVFQADFSKAKAEAMGSLFTLNQVPSVEQLVNSGALSLSDVIRLRRGKGRAFRKWFQSLWNNNDPDTQRVLQEYTAMLTNAANGPTPAYRMSVFGLTSLAGFANGLLGLTLSAAEQFVLPNLMSKPYLLFQSLRRYSSDR